MIRRKTLVIAVLAQGGLATAPCAAGDIAQLQLVRIRRPKHAYRSIAAVNDVHGGAGALATADRYLHDAQREDCDLGGFRRHSQSCRQRGNGRAAWNNGGLRKRPERNRSALVQSLVGNGSRRGCKSSARDGVRRIPRRPYRGYRDLLGRRLFVLHLEDRTTHRSFTTPPQTCDPNHTCPRSSAEFIVERPGKTSLPLGNYGSVVFNELLVRASSNLNFQWAKVTMSAGDSDAIMSTCGARFDENLTEPFIVLPVEIGCEWNAATP
jgi:hypothetical protein